MTTRQTQIFLLVAIIVLAAAIAATIFLFPEPNKGFRDAGSALTVITLVSVGIERVLEGFWTYIGLTRGTWWPLNAVSQQITNLASDLNLVLTPFYEQLTKAVEDAKSAGQLTQEQYTVARQEITDFQQSIDQLKTLAPGSQQGLAIASAASQLINNFQQKYKTLDTVATVANQAITGFAQFIVTPTDNLGRRFISLFLGMLLGLGIAGVLGLDLVQAIFQPATATQSSVSPFHLGTVLTGLVMGLGSSPTHEVIRVLQELKTNLKTQSTGSQAGT